MTTTKKRMRLNRIAGPNTQPVSVAGAKKQLEIPESITSHNDYLLELIEAATEQFEKDTALIPIQQRFELVLDQFPDYAWINLPVRPVTELISITYTDEEDATQSLSGSVAALDRLGKGVFLNRNQNWPTIPCRRDAVVVTFDAGYATASTVPRYIKRAIGYQVGKWFEDREMLGSNTTDEQFDKAYERIVRRLKRPHYPMIGDG